MEKELGAKWYKASGAKYYEKKLLLTNPSSQNPWIKKLNEYIGQETKYQLTGDKNLNELLLDRSNRADYVTGLHVTLGVLFCVLAKTTWEFNQKELASFIMFLNFIGNFCPIVVQQRIITRVEAVLEKRLQNNFK